MSIAMMEWARRQVTGASERRFLLITLASYADERGYCWPSIERLADDTEMSIRVVLNGLRDLERMRFIARAEAPTPESRYRFNVIKMRPQEGDDPALLSPFAALPKPPRKGAAKPMRASSPADADFEMFWRNYPNKIGSGAARKKFVSVITSGKATLDQLLDGLERYLNKKDDRPWCLPATWLEQERWKDETTNMGITKDKGPARPGI